ncbi:DUF7601 domain-containing protein [Slackia heliotrinireducens]|uniref:DUF7601 domain-containing protein n=1 Tax=Slackia heliotrinireducens TaxID=84110 RepID=UPI0033158656
MKFRKIAATLALSAALALGFALPAFAADAPQVNKTLQTNTGSTVTETFKYTAEFLPSVSITGEDVADGLKTEATGPALTIADINLSAADAETETEGTGALTFGEFPHAGYYAYKITETAGNTDGMTYDDAVYTLLVQRDNDGNNNYFVYEGEKSSIGIADEKADGLEFTNTYTETTDENDTNLEIEKTVAGAQGDQTKDFEFTVTFTAPTYVPEGWTVANIEASKDGVTVGADGKCTFTLKHGEKITFSNVIAGTTYAVEETAVTGYDQSYEAVANGENKTEQANLLIGENENTGTMTNTYEDITVTGLVLNNAPFILMALVAVGGVVAYGALKRKLTA